MSLSGLAHTESASAAVAAAAAGAGDAGADADAGAGASATRNTSCAKQQLQRGQRIIPLRRATQFLLVRSLSHYLRALC